MSDTLRIIPLGGLGEVGKNMTVCRAAGEILVVDAGLAFPRDEHLGVDLLLPDVGYLQGRKVRAVVLTHGHEDHVGGLPYLLREVDVEAVVSTRLTLGLVKSKLDEHGVGQAARLIPVGRQTIRSISGRSASSSSAWRTRSRLGRPRHRDRGRARRAHRGPGSSTTRRSTG